MAHSANITPMTSSHPGRVSGDSEGQLTARPILPPENDGQHLAGGFPKSPKHKFSDSHSSLSSYTSSTQSGGHSRISSLSTVSGIQPFTSLLNDVPAFDTKLAEHQQNITGPGMVDIQPPSPRGIGVGHDPNMPPLDPNMKGPGRPGSPSDAILITRGMGSNRSSPTDGLRTHKRTVSAPDFAAISAPTFQPFPSVSETAPFPSQQPYAMSPPESPPPVANQDEIKCMYIENCDTGSQPRKAISHIFGRNKLCTRMIPAHVWVHFCRKHYQRSRYRNAHEYSKLQVDLVQKQIARVQQWSDENERAGKAGVVNSWSLAIRKREQKRLEDKKESKKRAYQDESDEEQLDGAMLNGTAVPEWLLSKCGAGYTTVAIQEIVAQLKTEIDNGGLSQIPDIEILPTISSDGPDEKPKTYLKRKTSGGAAHKRSQSMGVALRPEALPMARRVSQPNNYWGHEGSDTSLLEKRQRITDKEVGYYEDRNAMPGMPRVPSGMRRMNIPHRPAFGNIREGHPEEDYYRQPQMGSGPFVFGAGGPQGGPLPAPTPQRRGSKSMASHLETSTTMPTYPDPRRAYHQRSQSEIGGFHQAQAPTYRPNSSSGYAPAAYGYGSVEQDAYDGTYPRPHDNPFVQGAQPNYYEDPQRQYAYGASPFQPAPAPRIGPVGVNRHTRHQSTPNAPRGMHRVPSAHGFAVGPNMAPQHDQRGYEQTPSDHSRHSSYATPPVQSMQMQPMQPMPDAARH
ncbi:ORP1 like protein [Colletotrichum sojae]|uniref:ORP1 like protein n=1 Tax=Colletotrichum sojae TaxID=2175907 RepID=A0A8H6J6N1_9PEZI|nr:ORP1 like protein [Colletotrichum sojae]